MKLKQIYITRN